jgi:hypothetical protein
MIGGELVHVRLGADEIGVVVRGTKLDHSPFDQTVIQQLLHVGRQCIPGHAHPGSQFIVRQMTEQPTPILWGDDSAPLQAVKELFGFR